jgi:hypothetical protein
MFAPIALNLEELKKQHNADVIIAHLKDLER